MDDQTVKFTVALDNPPPLTEVEKAQLAALANMPDSEIDYSDIPTATEAFFQKAKRRKYPGFG